MGIDENFSPRLAKRNRRRQHTAHQRKRLSVVRKEDQPLIVPIGGYSHGAGLQSPHQRSTHDVLAKNGIESQRHQKLSEGRPNIKDSSEQSVQLSSTRHQEGPQTDEGQIRSMAFLNRISIVTTLTGAHAAAKAIKALRRRLEV